jgi:hypothetical protein
VERKGYEMTKILGVAFHSVTHMLNALKPFAKEHRIALFDPEHPKFADILLVHCALHARGMGSRIRKKTKLVLVFDSPPILASMTLESGSKERKLTFLDAKVIGDYRYVNIPPQLGMIEEALNDDAKPIHAIGFKKLNIIPNVITRISENSILEKINTFQSAIGDKKLREDAEKLILLWAFNSMDVESLEENLRALYGRRKVDPIDNLLASLKSENGTNLQKALTLVHTKENGKGKKITYISAAKRFNLQAYDLRYLYSQRTKIDKVKYPHTRVRDYVVKKQKGKTA